MNEIETNNDFAKSLQIELLSKDKEIERLNNIIKEAIDKLEESQKGLEEWHFDGYDPDLKEVIKILEGEEDEI